NIVRVSNARNKAAALILAAANVAHSYSPVGHMKEPFPKKEQLESVREVKPEALLKELGGAIRESNQLRACALVRRDGETVGKPRPLFDLCLRYAISEDGRLHGEKYYRTVTEEFATTRPSLRWAQLVALGRVTASAYGFSMDDKPGHRAPGY